MKSKEAPAVVVVPTGIAGQARTGSLMGLTKKQISKVLGFAPNAEDDPDKVKNSWGFTINGEAAGIWDYRGSHKDKEWSTYGPVHLVFPKHYRKG